MTSHQAITDYASVDFDDDVISFDLASEEADGGEFANAIQNVFNRQTAEIRSSTEISIQQFKQVSKARLRELMSKHNNEIFSFFRNPERTPSQYTMAQTLCKKYSRDIPSINRVPISRELNLDCSMNYVIMDLNENLFKHGKSDINELMTQLKWISNQYIACGEELMLLEKKLVEKLNIIDSINKRIPMLTTLQGNEFLPGVVDSFEKYVKKVFEDLKIEDLYKELVNVYKKWNVFREIFSFQMRHNMESPSPICSICLSENISHAIIPCGHTLCASCMKKIHMSCYVCRGVVRERVKLFFN